MNEIDTYLYSGFLDAGKTSFIQDNLFHDYFYRHGSTLILCFEEGEQAYEEAALSERRGSVSFYEGNETVRDFCLREIARVKPDRVIIEDNVMIPDLSESLPDVLRIRAKTSLISGVTLAPFFRNLKPQFTQVLKDANLVLFNRVSDKESLAAYSTPFRLINPRASYLWQSPMGYHEKAFGIPLTYDKNDSVLTIREEDYACFYLDSLESPEDYSGKMVELTLQIQDEPVPDDTFVFGGRKVFTCCFADIQNLGFFIRKEESFQPERYSWVHISAKAYTASVFHQKRLCLSVQNAEQTAPPKQELIGLESRGNT
ncbi:MAG: hypothetical protein IKS32_11635 [Solobacterium sp.]|nr:hypothetical protein [Solobacterium sp.]